MKIFRLNWPVHVAWLSVIFAVVFYGENRLERADFLRNDLFKATQNALPVIEKIALLNYYSINKYSDAYRYPYYISLDSMAEVGKIEVAKFMEANELLARNAFDGELADAKNEVKKQLGDFQKLTGQLASFCKPDTTSFAELSSPLVSINSNEKIVEWIDLLKRNHPSAQLALFKNLALRASLAEKIVNQSIQKRVDYKTDLRPDKLMPVMIMPSPIRAGEILEAEFFWMPYSSTLKNLSCIINGKSWPVEQGLVHFEQVYHEPGRKKLDVEFIIQNPITGSIRNYTKEFRIEIQPESDSQPAN